MPTKSTNKTRSRKNAAAVTSTTTVSDHNVETFNNAFSSYVSDTGTYELIDVQIAAGLITDVEVRNAAVADAVALATQTNGMTDRLATAIDAMAAPVTNDPAVVLARQLVTITHVQAALLADTDLSVVAVDRATALAAGDLVSPDENATGRIIATLARLAGRKSTNESHGRAKRFNPELVLGGSAARTHVEAYLRANPLTNGEFVSANVIAAAMPEGTPYTVNPSPGAIADYVSGKNVGSVRGGAVIPTGGTKRFGWIGHVDGKTVGVLGATVKHANEANDAVRPARRGRRPAGQTGTSEANTEQVAS